MAARLPDNGAQSRIDFSTTDASVAIDYYQDVYRTHMSFSGIRDGVAYTHSRLGVELFAIDELQLPLNMDVTLDPFKSLIVINLQAGQYGRECAGTDECFVGGDVFIIADPHLPANLRLLDTKMQTTMLDLSVLAQVATTSPTRAPGPVRFTGFQPISHRLANWRRTTKYVHELLVNTEATAQPLIRGAAARMLAAAALTTFPNTAVIAPAAQDRRDATSATVRRAIAFIEQHPDIDLSVADMAAAANVSIRAVQMAFRRHLDTTPMHYLRDIRLDHVHQELLSTDPASGATVTSIATTWGFYNHSRFTASYRRAYGRTQFHLP
ncbi:MAG TPA: helix-turn-helix domain-containing protein [Pseudonocardia sp.]